MNQVLDSSLGANLLKTMVIAWFAPWPFSGYIHRDTNTTHSEGEGK